MIKNEFGGMDVVDWDCPHGVPWADVTHGATSTFNGLYNEIKAEGGSDMLLVMAAQCKEMHDNPPKGITCKNLREYRKRWFTKLKYYRRTYNEKTSS